MIALDQHVTEHKEDIIKQWLETCASKGSWLHSAKDQKKLEQKLKDQHESLVTIVAKSLRKEDVKDELNRWSLQCARDRVVHEVSVTESVGQFNAFRHIMFEWIQTFSEAFSQEIGIQDIYEWSRILNQTIDEIIEVFTGEYSQVTMIQLNAQKEMINELSAPIMPISDGIGILPLVGEIDTYRARTILESVLQQCSALKLSYLFLDISGVPIVDTMVAYQIFKVIDSTKLLGIETIISGIRPEIAQTVVKLGLDFSNVKTEQSLAKALANKGFKIEES
ncbi:STAS domain-containing protein [Bacillus vallismortis]|uniref:STAS domain-containing protein n=1 Tax=Bacillus vallismortis TaxID=72361 RepID=A0AAP3CM82_BACVA|nr:STAS domain-containing protein [Bacillus vallismortis]MCI4136399.1 STAS domain-containing protein [Bacillus vallismortis]MCY7893708.1 STAS domain-containing protein [Bacillus vallismortis]MCY8317620.1 STAS domain-containing protein [Bacillus vallismortis]MCY8426788.1 STAS domain-containing protein [Bacillus vallismortis]MCY8534473.1 STAS domain-containing protein [Bacillus vallismortis]